MALAMYDHSLVYDRVTLRLLPGRPAFVTDPETGIPVEGIQDLDGNPLDQLISNSQGIVQPFNVLDGPPLIQLRIDTISYRLMDLSLLGETSRAAQEAAQAAIDAANLVDAPADVVIAAAINSAGSQTRAALDALLDGVSGASSWDDITNKPATFPPSPHSHGAADLSGVVKTINSTAPDSSGNINISAGGGSSKTIREVLVGEDINAALAGYEGEVRLQRGVHTTAVPIVQNRRQKAVGEGGGATIIRATAAMDALWKIGNGAPADRTHLSDLCLDADGLAGVGLDMNIVGTTGNYNGEPDGQAHIERLYIDDATDIGVYARGGDTQAYHMYGVRARRAGNYGFRIDVGGPDAWILDCEATTSNTGTGAGFLVGSSNLHFKGCKAWYCRGYGWQIKGTRNIFMDCESQDTRLHGWMIEWDKNQFIGCMADSAGYADVGGVSNTQDGFYLASGLSMTTLAGCASFDREQGFPAQQRYGFNMSASTYNVGRAGSATAAAAGTGTTPVMIGPLMGGNPATPNYKNLGGLLNLR